MTKQIITALILLVVGGVTGNLLRFEGKLAENIVTLTQIPDQTGDYYGQENPLDSITLSVLSADAAIMKEYRDSDGRRYDLFVGYFRKQAFGSAIHSPKNCLPGSGWRIRNQFSKTIQLDDSTFKEVRDLRIGYKTQSSIMLYWFETRVGSTRSEYGLKYDLFRSAILFNPTDAAFIRITVDVQNGDVEEAMEAGISFARQIYPSVRNALPF